MLESHPEKLRFWGSVIFAGGLVLLGRIVMLNLESNEFTYGAPTLWSGMVSSLLIGLGMLTKARKIKVG